MLRPGDPSNRTPNRFTEGEPANVCAPDRLLTTEPEGPPAGPASGSRRGASGRPAGCPTGCPGGNLSMCARQTCPSAPMRATAASGLPGGPSAEGQPSRRRPLAVGREPEGGSSPWPPSCRSTRDREHATRQLSVPTETRCPAPKPYGSNDRSSIATPSVVPDRQVWRAHVCRFPFGQPDGCPVGRSWPRSVVAAVAVAGSPLP